MNAQADAGQTGGTEGAAARLTVKQLARTALAVLLLPVALFLAAGRLDWSMGWVYIVLSHTSFMIGRLLLRHKHPGLVTERWGALEAADAPTWDKAMALTLALFLPLAVLIVAGLDERFGWSPPLPAGYPIAGVIAMVVGLIIGNWALLTNRFFSLVVRIQTERGHTVVTGGPYRFVRHPGYAGTFIVWLGTPLILSSLWAFIPTGLIVILLFIRTGLEDRMLQAELPGYKEYTQQTRYRLIPGIW